MIVYRITNMISSKQVIYYTFSVILMRNRKNEFVRMIMFTLFTVMLLLINSQIVCASEYYVATSGDNSNTGLSPDNPWLTLSYATNKLEAGDTLYLMNGTWYNESIVFKNYGTAEAPIIITAYDGTPTLIGEGSGNAISMVAYPADMQYISVSNLTIINYYNGIYVEAAAGNHEVSNIIFHNNNISGIINHAIYIRRIGESDYIINNITLSNNVVSDFGGSGIYMLGVRDSIIIDNVIKDSVFATGLVGIGYSIHNCIIEGNYLENISTSYGISGSTSTKNNIVKSNTIRNVTGRGIRFDYYSHGNTISDNIIANTGGTGINLYPYTYSIVENNTVTNSSIWVTGVGQTLFKNNLITSSSVNIGGIESARSQVIFEYNIVTDSKSFNVYHTNDSTFNNNQFSYITTPNAFQFFTGENSPSYNITLANNIFTHISGNAVYVGWSEVYGLNISKNTFINVDGFCVKNSKGHDVYVSSNIIIECNSPYFYNVLDSITPSDTTPTIQAGQSQQFSATTNGEGTFVWTLDGATVRTTPSVTTDSYTASGLAAGEYTVLLTVTSGEGSVTQTWTLTVEEEPVTPPVEPSTPLDLTVQQIAMAVVLAGLIPLIIVSVMLLNGMDGFKNIAPDKITIALVVICVMLVLTVLIINPIANLI